jgi:hypothetical protein
VIKNKFISTIIVSFLLGSFAFATLEEDKRNMHALYSTIRALNLTQPDQLQRAERNLRAMYILADQILAQDALAEERVSQAISHTERRIQMAGGQVGRGQQVSLNAAALAQLPVGTPRPSTGTRANSVASAAMTGISVFTSLTDRQPITRTEALRPREFSNEDLWNQAVLDVGTLRSGPRRSALLVVLTFLAGDLPARQQLVQSLGNPQANHELLIRWAQESFNNLSEEAGGMGRAQRTLNSFASANRAVILRLEYLNRYFAHSSETQGYAGRIRAIAAGLHTNLIISDAVARAMPVQPVRTAQRRQREEGASQPETIVPSTVPVFYPNIAVRRNGPRTPVRALENAGGGNCLFLSLGTTRQTLLAGIRATRQTNQNIQHIFLQSVASGGPDYNNWQRSMGRRLGGDLETGLWSAWTGTPLRIFNLQGNFWVEGHLVNPTNSQGAERWIGYIAAQEGEGGHWVELQPGNPAAPATQAAALVGSVERVVSNAASGLASLFMPFRWGGSSSR